MQVILRIVPESFPKALNSIYSTSGSKTVFHAVEGLLEGFFGCADILSNEQFQFYIILDNN